MNKEGFLIDCCFYLLMFGIGLEPIVEALKLFKKLWLMISSVILLFMSNWFILCLAVNRGELATSSTIGVPGRLLFIELLLLI